MHGTRASSERLAGRGDGCGDGWPVSRARRASWWPAWRASLGPPRARASASARLQRSPPPKTTDGCRGIRTSGREPRNSPRHAITMDQRSHRHCVTLPVRMALGGRQNYQDRDVRNPSWPGTGRVPVGRIFTRSSVLSGETLAQAPRTNRMFRTWAVLGCPRGSSRRGAGRCDRGDGLAAGTPPLAGPFGPPSASSRRVTASST